VLLPEDPQTGNLLEPIEEVVIDVDEEFSGVIIEKLSLRKGEMTDMRSSGSGRTRLSFLVPSRGLIGYQGTFLTDTKGTGVMSRLFSSYAPCKSGITTYRNGVLISMGQGEAVAYALFHLQKRGVLFVEPRDKVYVGMIVGENNRDNDLEVNVLKGKQLTNIRASGTDEAVRLTSATLRSLEEMIAYIGEDELLEVTPKSLRLRKRLLGASDRKKAARR